MISTQELGFPTFLMRFFYHPKLVVCFSGDCFFFFYHAINYHFSTAFGEYFWIFSNHIKQIKVNAVWKVPPLQFLEPSITEVLGRNSVGFWDSDP